jgi:hypothetical protein
MREASKTQRGTNITQKISKFLVISVYVHKGRISHNNKKLKIQ